MTALEVKKYKLIDWIIRLKDEKLINAIEQLQSDDSSSKQATVKTDIKYSTYAAIKTQKVDIERLEIEQNYSPSSSEELTAIATAADIKEPIDR